MCIIVKRVVPTQSPNFTMFSHVPEYPSLTVESFVGRWTVNVIEEKHKRNLLTSFSFTVFGNEYSWINVWSLHLQKRARELIFFAKQSVCEFFLPVTRTSRLFRRLSRTFSLVVTVDRNHFTRLKRITHTMKS